jgi:hypothetical protein
MKVIISARKFVFVAIATFFSSGLLFAQEKQDLPEVLARQSDVKDVINSIFSKNKAAADTGGKHKYFTILPSAGYNPSVGISVGFTSTAGKQYGDPKSTTLSIYNANGYISTFGLFSGELRENVFTANDEYNIVGIVQGGKTVALDYGVGTGRPAQSDGSFSINSFSLANNADIFPIQYTYLKINERIYKRIFDHIYVGAGIVADFYTNIDDQRLIGPNLGSHNVRYSHLYGYPTDGYQANGFLFNFEYNSRDQINRPYRGLYIDLVLRSNQTWLGSNHQALQLKTEVRKYWSLSHKNPEHVLAYWLWGQYLLNGTVPYLELPGTGSDASNRLGRAYTIGRFKGPSFFDSEGEYRFPITANKLLGGVVFANVQTASNPRNVNPIAIFQYIEPGAGVGLRLLFNKYTRSNLCIDYGRGNYGSSGLFLGLNEVF